MTEAERIDSINTNGGKQLQHFKKENITYDMCLAAVLSTGRALYYVPEEYRTKEIYAKAVSRTGSMLSYVPINIITKKMCKEAVTSDGLALEFVPDKYKEESICFIAACNNPIAMQHMPENLITTDFVVRLVKKYGDDAICSLPKSLKNVKFYLPIVEQIPNLIWKLPKNFHTATLCKTVIKAMGYKSIAEAVKKNPSLLSQLHTSLYDYDTCSAFIHSSYFEGIVKTEENGLTFSGTVYETEGILAVEDYEYSLKHILRWADLAEKAVCCNYQMLTCVDRKIITYELCKKAVSANGNAYKYVPNEFRLKELCQLAIMMVPWNISEVPEEFINVELSMLAVKESGYNLDYVPERCKTYEVCFAAVSQEGREISEVPEDVMDKELCISAIRNSGNHPILEFIPESMRGHDVCMAAIEQVGEDLEYVPEVLKDYDICYLAAQKSGYVGKYIPKAFFTQEVCLALVRNSYRAIEDIPSENLTYECCLEAIDCCNNQYVGTILDKVPDELRSQKMCDRAVEISVDSFAYVPERFVTEEMLISVANRACGRVCDNFPDRFRTHEFITKLMKINQSVEGWLRFNNIKPLD